MNFIWLFNIEYLSNNLIQFFDFIRFFFLFILVTRLSFLFSHHTYPQFDTMFLWRSILILSSPIEKNGMENGYDQQQQTLIPLGEVSIMNIIHFIKARKPKYPTKLKSHSLGKVRKFKIIHMLQSPIWLRYDSWLTISTEEFNYYLVAVCLLCSDWIHFNCKYLFELFLFHVY